MNKIKRWESSRLRATSRANLQRGSFSLLLSLSVSPQLHPYVNPANCSFQLYFAIAVDIQYCIHFRYTAEWLDIPVIYEVIASDLSSPHLTPHIVITILSTLLPMLYFTPL